MIYVNFIYKFIYSIVIAVNCEIFTFNFCENRFSSYIVFTYFGFSIVLTLHIYAKKLSTVEHENFIIYWMLILLAGASNFCLTCGHGGHASHMLEWFKEQNTCPTGCGCKCLQGKTYITNSIDWTVNYRYWSNTQMLPLLKIILSGEYNICTVLYGQILSSH